MGRFIPRGIEPQGGRGKAVWTILLTLVLLLAVPRNLCAQSSDGTRTFYVPSRSFNIPFSFRGMDNDPRVEVLLNVSTDGLAYRHIATAKPHEQRFFFPAQTDGWYTFIVQTRDAGGALTPAVLSNAAERIRICVDTQKPAIEEFTSVQENPLPTIRWNIVETNLKEILADYRPLGSPDWIPLFIVPVENQGRHTWRPAWSGDLEVRMQAVDKAGNKSEIRTLRLRTADNVTRMQPPPDTAVAGKVMHVRSKTFQLQYSLDDTTVGPSQVERVDIWKIHPGQRWEKCKEKGNPQGPATVTVESSGRWGFRLIPRSGAGLAEPDPKPGDAPDIWVEVDDKAPQVTITKVTVTQEPDGGYLTVYWTADDTFLRSMPITIFLAAPNGGQWNPVATDLPNNGNWRQRTDVLDKNGYEFSIKVEAIDEAGNKGFAQWRDVVKIDLKIPRIKDIKVNPGAAPASSGQDAYGPTRAPSFGGQGNSSLLQLPLSGQPLTSTPASSINATGRDFANPTPPKR